MRRIVALLLGFAVVIGGMPPTPAAADDCIPTLNGGVTFTQFDTLRAAINSISSSSPRTSLLERTNLAQSLLTANPSAPALAAGILRGWGNETCGLQQSGVIESTQQTTIQSASAISSPCCDPRIPTGPASRRTPSRVGETTAERPAE